MKRSLTIVTLLFAAAVAHATTMLKLDLKTLTERADRVVLGTVEQTVSRWTTDKSAIYTEAQVRVARSYKGDVKAGDVIVVRREGGTVDGIGMRVYGAATFRPGEELVLFVEQRAGATWVVGMAQGKLHVSTDASGRKHVAADLSGVHFIAPAAPEAPRALDDLEREIRGYVRSGK